MENLKNNLTKSKNMYLSLAIITLPFYYFIIWLLPCTESFFWAWRVCKAGLKALNQLENGDEEQRNNFLTTTQLYQTNKWTKYFVGEAEIMKIPGYLRPKPIFSIPFLTGGRYNSDLHQQNINNTHRNYMNQQAWNYRMDNNRRYQQIYNYRYNNLR